ncbi:MAG: mechanosensitive ion channel family protein [Actinobacteria bacterium]|nr:mechanosensitive ion channel family protein [Actinomycetota bacterium]
MSDQDWQEIGRRAVEWLLVHGLRLAVILVLAVAVSAGTRRLTRRFEKRIEQQDAAAGRDLHRAKMLASVAQGALSILVWSISLLLVLGEIGINLGPLLAGAGVAGLAIGFGAQSLVRDFFAGFFVLLEDQYRVGDIIELEGVAGVVERFSLRLTSLRGLDGTLHHIPNGNIQRVSNSSAGWAKAIVDVGVAYDEDLERVKDVIVRAGADLMQDPEIGPLILSPPEILGVEDFAESQVTLRTVVMTPPGKRWPVGRAMRRRIKELFDIEGITIPFPHRVMVQAEADGRLNKGDSEDLETLDRE